MIYKNPIFSYLPYFMRSYEELKHIMTSTQVEIDNYWAEVEKALNNQFVLSADEESIKRYEQMYNIKGMPNQTLDERRFNIIVKMNETLAYTMGSLLLLLEQLCGKGNYDVELDNDQYFLLVKLGLVVKNNFVAVEDLINRVVPANIVVEIRIMFNQQGKLNKYTHSELSAFTHKQIREEENI